MYKVSCNVTSRTTYWSEFPIYGAVETAQELCEVPEQVIYMLYIFMAGTLVEKP